VRRIAAIALLLLATPAPAQTLDDLLAAAAECPETTCPRPPDPPGWNLVIAVPDPAWEAGTRIELDVRPGLRMAAGGGRCGILTARARRGDQVSPESSLTPDPDCVPVPEPGLWLGLAVGVLGVALASKSSKCAMMRLYID